MLHRPDPATTHPPVCVDCGAPATVEALRVDADNTLLSDVTTCADHADPYLAGATDVVDLHPDTLPAHLPMNLPTVAAGPLPARDDRVHVDGRTWEVWDVQATPGGHEVVLFTENPDDDARWQTPGSLTTVTWHTTTDPQPGTAHQQAPAPVDDAGPPSIDPTGRANAAHLHTWVPTPVEQDAIDWARAEAADQITGPSPRQALNAAERLFAEAVDYQDDLTDTDLADQAPEAADATDLADTADLGL